jgi:ADP-L-glycero-D-manno-heptose 6-epimerase
MIAVTGAAGFIGSCFITKLNNEGYHDILVIDTLQQDDRWKNLSGKRFRTIEHPEVFRTKCIQGHYSSKDITAIIHLGACSATTERNADYLLDNNYRYSKDIAEFALHRSIPFMYASSAATYGAGEKGYSDTSCYGFSPLNMYGYSKQLFDEWMMNMSYVDNAIGIKFFNVFGPNEYHKLDMASMIFKAYNQIQKTGYIKLFASNDSSYSNGGQLRDFIYIKDACNVMWKLLSDTSLKGLINLGTGKARSWNDLASAVFAAMNLPVNIEYVPMPISLLGQYQNYTQADMTTLLQSVSAYSFMELEDSISDYICNYLMPIQQYY